MKLTELHPHWIGNGGEGGGRYLEFDCPALHNYPESDMACKIVLPVDIAVGTSWHQEGAGDSFETLTISPSIWHHCKEDPHFFIRNGEIIYA